MSLLHDFVMIFQLKFVNNSHQESDLLVLLLLRNDYTKKIIEGARKVLKVVKILNIRKAILKSKSPSCGKDLIFDGTFNGNLIKGDGVLTALLKKHGIKVYSEKEI